MKRLIIFVLAIALAGCVTSKTAQYDPVTGNLIFLSKASGSGSKVAEAQKALKVVNADGSGIDMTAGIQGMDTASAMMAGMQMVQQSLMQFIKMQEALKMYELQNPVAEQPGIEERLLNNLSSGPFGPAGTP